MAPGGMPPGASVDRCGRLLYGRPVNGAPMRGPVAFSYAPVGGLNPALSSLRAPARREEEGAFLAT
jgi:hypothetical protein